MEELARMMIHQWWKLEDIVDATGLDEDEVKEIMKNEKSEKD